MYQHISKKLNFYIFDDLYILVIEVRKRGKVEF
jgi:hypothetical protein